MTQFLTVSLLNVHHESFSKRLVEVNIYSLHTNNITKTPGIFDKPLIGQIYIDNWIDKKMIGYYNIDRL